jgi:hypothetical protein
MNAQKKVLLVLAGILIVSIIVLISNKSPNDGESNFITDPRIMEGKQLADQYCGGCHKVPDPNLLPWRTWRFETLAAMAPFLGVYDPQSTYDPNRNRYLPDNFYPSDPIISQEEWQKIRDYYLNESSQEWTLPEKNPAIITDTLFFEAHFSNVQSKLPPAITTVKFDPGNRLIYASDFQSEGFMVFNDNLELEHSFDIESTIANIQILSDDWETEPGPREFLLTFMGNLYPSDAPYGFVQTGWLDPEIQNTGLDSVFVSDITRPVESKFVDLNKDGKKDLLINEFGHRMGSLFWMENKGDGNPPEKRILIDTPGCIQSYVADYTRNGWPDVLSLCTQTDQAIYLFSNEGDGQFERSTLLEFEVTAGSSSFEIHDFNKDGYPDILYTSGDNADFSKVFKPYHGVFIYLNDGQNQFKQQWFYPINGAYNAKARDFDGDGLLDIAVISFFADYKNTPEEGFLYFKNEGDLLFSAYHHPAATSGRWQTMDVADWTGNGRDDIVLANFSMGYSMVSDSIMKKWKETPHILVLENKSKQ